MNSLLPLCPLCHKHHWAGKACHEVDDIKEQPVSEFAPDLMLSRKFDPIFMAAYEQAFPTLYGSSFLEDKYNQQHGCDRLLSCMDKQVYIEEKVECAHKDFVLEFESNDVFHTKGWIEKDLKCDYLAYFVAQRCEVYIFPWPELAAAWKQYGAEWKARFEWTNPRNRRGGRDSRTHCVVVPRHILVMAVPVYHMYRYKEGEGLLCNLPN